MPRITDIKIQVKNTDKVSVFLDGKYIFSLTISQLADFKNLKIGNELSDHEVVEFKKISSLTNLYLRMVNLVFVRPRSEYEIKTKLKQKKLESEEVEQIIERLKTANYLNDSEFTKWWINTRKSSRPISKLKLKAELAQKGIMSDLVTQILESEFSSEDELNSLNKLIEKKRNKYETDEKLMAFLASKGFSYSQIKAALKSESEDEW